MQREVGNCLCLMDGTVVNIQRVCEGDQAIRPHMAELPGGGEPCAMNSRACKSAMLLSPRQAYIEENEGVSKREVATGTGVQERGARTLTGGASR